MLYSQCELGIFVLNKNLLMSLLSVLCSFPIFFSCCFYEKGKTLDGVTEIVVIKDCYITLL